MKIGVYDPYLDDVGGGEKYMLSIAQCLSKKHEVTLFWNNKEDIEIAKQRFNLSLEKVNLSANIFSPGVSFLKRVLVSRKFDCLIVLSDGSIPFVLSKKLFLHIQRPIIGAGKSLKSRIKLARVNKVFCNSYFTKSYIDRQLGTECSVLYPPIDLKPKKIEKENIILHVGRFRLTDITVGGAKDYKKQNVMIEAFKDMVKKGLTNWRFVLAVGVKEEDETALSNLVESAKGAPIEFLINKSNDELWDIYSKSKIYWHASGYGEDLIAHPEFAEHFGISTVEAMGAGVVPVVINAGGQKEIIDDGLNGFLWDSLDELKEKTLMLTREDTIRTSMAKEAAKKAETFAGDRFCEELKKMIES
ncbi:MAG: glycosyltransferase family 4 protein [bacterium]|nr:glycosyltransferase family 4 protein [bacterium]